MKLISRSFIYAILCDQQKIFLDPFLCNFMRPKTSDNDFSRENK